MHTINMKKKKKQNASTTRLHILLISGHDLLAKDLHHQSDPYIIFKQGHCSVRSQVLQKTLNPIWNEKLEMGISDLTKELEVEVYDKDIIKDDPMGRAFFSLGTLTDSPQEVILKLKGDAGLFSRNHGYLKVQFWISGVNVPHTGAPVYYPQQYYPPPPQAYGGSPPQQGYGGSPPPQGGYPPQGY